MGLLRSRSKAQWRFKMPVNVCPDDIFWTTEHFVTKSGMVIQHHKPECHAEELFYCVQCHGHSKGLYNQNMTISFVSSKLLKFATKLGLLVQQHSQSVLLKNGVTAFKVKVTAKVQNVSEWLSWYFLCVSDCVCSVSPEPLNHVGFFVCFFNQTLYWESWCVMQKNWFTIFNVKVTARSYQNQAIFTI